MIYNRWTMSKNYICFIRYVCSRISILKHGSNVSQSSFATTSNSEQVAKKMSEISIENV